MQQLRNTGEVPCKVLYPVARGYLFGTLPSPHRSAQEPVTVLPEGSGKGVALQQARSLVDSERLHRTDLLKMLQYGIYMTEPGWLPCRDDKQRDQFRYTIETDVPVARLRCPLQIRAILGDQAVACAEAQVLHPPESLVRQAREAFPEGMRPSEAAPDPVVGTPADPVRRLSLRPCQLLGQVLAEGLPPYLCQLAADRKWLEADLRLLVERRPAGGLTRRTGRYPHLALCRERRSPWLSSAVRP